MGSSRPLPATQLTRRKIIYVSHESVSSNPDLQDAGTPWPGSHVEGAVSRVEGGGGVTFVVRRKSACNNFFLSSEDAIHSTRTQNRIDWHTKREGERETERSGKRNTRDRVTVST